MNLRLFSPALSLLLGVLLTGCASFNDAELGTIRSSGISPRVYTKMQEGRELRPEDVIELTRRHVPEHFIVRQIEDTGVDYVLTAEDFKRLQQARVARPVVDALVAASDEFSNRYAAPRRAVFYTGPDPYPYDYYDDGFYGPRPIGGIGIGIYGGRGHWRR